MLGPMKRKDNPERLIPVIPNDILLGLIQTCNISLEAHISPAGLQYLNIEFWHELMDKSIILQWGPDGVDSNGL